MHSSFGDTVLLLISLELAGNVSLSKKCEVKQHVFSEEELPASTVLFIAPSAGIPESLHSATAFLK